MNIKTKCLVDGTKIIEEVGMPREFFNKRNRPENVAIGLGWGKTRNLKHQDSPAQKKYRKGWPKDAPKRKKKET